MRMAFYLLVALSLVTMAAPSLAQSSFAAFLSADQVVGGTSSTASGFAELTLNVAEDALSYSITLVGLDLDGAQTPLDSTDDVTGLHFHAAPPGVNGGVAFGLVSPNHDIDDLVIDPVAGTLTGVWEETDSGLASLSSQLATLESGGLYLNVHTVAYAGGEIRGQVLPVIFADGFESGDVLRWSTFAP